MVALSETFLTSLIASPVEALSAELFHPVYLIAFLARQVGELL